jgi:hypothetical protein
MECVNVIFNPNDAIVLDVPVIVKAREDGGRRLVEVEASNELVDSQGDVILQAALMEAAPEFIASGALDIDHISELGDRMGIPNPSSYIVGRPTQVKDLGGGRTGVVGEISRAPDGVSRPEKNKYDELWESLRCTPPVIWRASVYGYPTQNGLVTANSGEDTQGASRYLIRGFLWKSLAFTRRPVNDSIIHAAKIVTAKSYMTDLAKQYPTPINSMMDAYNNATCEECKCHTFPSTVSYRNHFEKCKGIDPGQAEILSNAVMHFSRKIGKPALGS